MAKSIKSDKITKIEFNKIWKEMDNKDRHKRAFMLLSNDPAKKFVSIADFKVLFKDILDIHPGLEFLKHTPEFQEWYSICVINRMFYVANRKGDYKMTLR